jgi:hypothetical protein
VEQTGAGRDLLRLTILSDRRFRTSTTRTTVRAQRASRRSRPRSTRRASRRLGGRCRGFSVRTASDAGSRSLAELAVPVPRGTHHLRLAPTLVWWGQLWPKPPARTACRLLVTPVCRAAFHVEQRTGLVGVRLPGNGPARRSPITVLPPTVGLRALYRRIGGNSLYGGLAVRPRERLC